MEGRIKKEIDMFINGFKMLIQGETLEIFQPRELQEMVIGNENYDWTEFKKVGLGGFMGKIERKGKLWTWKRIEPEKWGPTVRR